MQIVPNDDYDHSILLFCANQEQISREELEPEPEPEPEEQSPPPPLKACKPPQMTRALPQTPRDEPKPVAQVMYPILHITSVSKDVTMGENNYITCLVPKYSLLHVLITSK